MEHQRYLHLQHEYGPTLDLHIGCGPFYLTSSAQMSYPQEDVGEQGD